MKHPRPASLRPAGRYACDAGRVPTPGDARALESLDRKFLAVRDFVTGVVQGYYRGLYLYGEGGLGKSFTVFDHLDGLGCRYEAFNSRVTGAGLFRALGRWPDALHVIEDTERLTSDRDAQSLLRSALWSQAGRDPVATWTTSKGEQRFTFRGAIIMVTNRPMADLPELRALATRIPVYELQASWDELAAHMRRIAGRGLIPSCGDLLPSPAGIAEVSAGPDGKESRQLGMSRYQNQIETKTLCEICEFVIAQCRQAQRPLDLRLFDNACATYLLGKSDIAHLHWEDLVTIQIRQAASQLRHGVVLPSGEERRAKQRDIARAILQETEDPEEQVRLWKQRTKRGRSTFYRRKAEVENGEFDI
jgi:hypothetical protein